jgi:hypothetical protein
MLNRVILDYAEGIVGHKGIMQGRIIQVRRAYDATFTLFHLLT